VCVCVCVCPSVRPSVQPSDSKEGVHPTFYPCSNIILPDIMVLLAKVVEMIGGFVFVLMGSDTFGPFLQT
jgi:hypothetical protein